MTIAITFRSTFERVASGGPMRASGSMMICCHLPAPCLPRNSQVSRPSDRWRGMTSGSRRMHRAPRTQSCAHGVHNDKSPGGAACRSLGNTAPQRILLALCPAPIGAVSHDGRARRRHDAAPARRQGAASGKELRLTGWSTTGWAQKLEGRAGIRRHKAGESRAESAWTQAV